MIDPDDSGGAEPLPSDASEDGPRVDGRVARRERNVTAVIDVVLEMFAEESLFPTIEEVATRSGLSLRSMYRYFADPGELLEAAIARSRDIAVEVAHISAIGQGTLEKRIGAFVEMRLRVHETIGPRHRATVANAHRRPRIAEELTKTRDDFREQLELQFAPELDPMTPKQREAVVAASDLLTQIEAVDFLRRQRGFTVAQAKSVLTNGLKALLD